MQISVTPAGGGTFYLSGSNPAQGFQRLRLVPQSQVQDVPALGAADIGQIPRGNKKLTYTYVVQFEFPDAETAAYFGPAFEAQFPLQGPLVQTNANGSLYMASAVVVLTELETIGATCTLNYRITGGGFYRDVACTLLPVFPDPIG